MKPPAPAGAAVPSPDGEPPKTSLETIFAQRRETLRRLVERGVDPYPYSFTRTHTLSALLKAFEGPLPEPGSPEIVRAAGRLMTLRDMGKSCFAHLGQGPDRIQIYVKKDGVGESAYQFFQKDVGIGDFVGVEGTMFRTRTNELTVRASAVTLLAKALRPLPEKYHGLKDVEARYREREMDLAANADIHRLFAQRSRLLRSVGQTLESEGFLEVETPILQAQAGGAAARPFQTFHNALQTPLFMRIALELHLKRLLVGGMDRVFEIG